MDNDTTRIKALSRLCAADCIDNGLTLDNLDGDWDVWESDISFVEENIGRCMTSDELQIVTTSFREHVEAYFGVTA